MNGTSGGYYPLWIGLAATGLFGWLLWDTKGPAADPADAEPGDAARPDAAPDQPVPEDTLAWSVVGRPFPSAAELRACLEGQDYVASVTGIGDLTVAWKGVVAGLTSAGDAVRLVTPAAGRCHDAAGLHLATAWCLRAPGATVRDALLGTERRADRWPRPRSDGGLPLDVLVTVTGDPPRTLGLARFGLPEMTATGAGPATLYRAAGAFLVGCDPTASEIPLVGGGRATLAHSPGAPTIARIEAPRRPEPRPPTSSLDAPPRRPALPRPRRPSRPKPSFQPDYR